MKPRRPEDRPYFFDDGLRFTCTGCGQCCTGEPGTVHMNDAEADQIAARLGLARADFLAQYAYPFEDGHSLKEKPNGDCVFFEDRRCGIYEDRPTQCRTYPFWPENLRSEAAWKRTAKACPGVNAGRLHTREEILRRAEESP